MRQRGTIKVTQGYSLSILDPGNLFRYVHVLLSLTSSTPIGLAPLRSFGNVQLWCATVLFIKGRRIPIARYCRVLDRFVQTTMRMRALQYYVSHTCILDRLQANAPRAR